jgi:hypothetical protein
VAVPVAEPQLVSNVIDAQSALLELILETHSDLIVVSVFCMQLGFADEHV